MPVVINEFEVVADARGRRAARSGASAAPPPAPGGRIPNDIEPFRCGSRWQPRRERACGRTERARHGQRRRPPFNSARPTISVGGRGRAVAGRGPARLLDRARHVRRPVPLRGDVRQLGRRRTASAGSCTSIARCSTSARRSAIKLGRRRRSSTAAHRTRGALSRGRPPELAVLRRRPLSGPAHDPPHAHVCRLSRSPTSCGAIAGDHGLHAERRRHAGRRTRSSRR